LPFTGYHSSNEVTFAQCGVMDSEVVFSAVLILGDERNWSLCHCSNLPALGGERDPGAGDHPGRRELRCT